MGAMNTDLTLDFVSDVSCPWCAIGLSALQQAIAQVSAPAAEPPLTVSLRCQPFELNPQMPPGGQDIGEHLTQKYGSTPEQQAQIRETIRQRGAEVGLTFSLEGRARIYNTFDAHRLLYWAGLPTSRAAGQQLALKKFLFQAYFSEGENPAASPLLLRAAASVGLDELRAQQILSGDEYAAEVRAQERLYAAAGIQSVPAVILNEQHLISGSRSVAVYVQALRILARED